MPDFNPFAPTVEVGGNAGTGSGGPAASVNASAGGSLGNLVGNVGGDNHWTAGILLGSLVVLWALWQSKFRFSMTVG